MEILRDPREMRGWSREQGRAGLRLALVPTMGALHQGHLALVRLGRQLADAVVVSLFVNPTQFGPHEDFSRYPRSFEQDRRLVEAEGAAALYAPTAEAMYPSGFQTRIELPALGALLCGASRPGHFAGVATVVCKLLHQVTPQVAIFGEKDWQQLTIIRRLVTDLNLDVSIVGHPIVRETDGLAMSSRNVYLDATGRRAARALSRALRLARSLARPGFVTETLLDEVRALLANEPLAQIDYACCVQQHTLQNALQVDDDTRLLLAVRIQNTVRLIDNALLLGSAEGLSTLSS